MSLVVAVSMGKAPTNARRHHAVSVRVMLEAPTDAGPGWRDRVVERDRFDRFVDAVDHHE